MKFYQEIGGIFAAVLFLFSSVLFAAPYEIAFQSGTVVPEANSYQLPEARSALDGSRIHVLIQLEEYLNPHTKQLLSTRDVELLAYLPDRAYAASVPVELDLGELEDIGVRHLSPMYSEYKMHPRVMEERFGPWSRWQSERRIFSIEIMPDVDLSDAEAELSAFGLEVGVRIEAAHTLWAAASPADVPEIAALDFVLFINEIPPPLEEVNNIVRQRLHVNEVQELPYDLSGSGVTILVYDGGMVDSTHDDFGDRVTWNEEADIAAHSTHVAGTVGGDGSESEGTYRGMAPAARIISGQYDVCIPYCLYESPNDFEDDYTSARLTFDVELTTNSIGANISPNGYDCDWMGDYETTSRLLDWMTRSTAGRPLTMFFAAGNERGDPGCSISTYRCMSVPAGAKNIITVGATTSGDNVADFSSWGPTDDGRLKPEVCAMGVNVTSCAAGGGYTIMSGTSMATPAASGCACLILEQWHQLFPGAADPLPETMKAMLVNSTNDIAQTGPDYRTGYGLINAQEAVDQLLAGGVLEGIYRSGDHFTHTFTIEAGSDLDVSLAWSDWPAAGNVIPTLVNDLDLWLEGPTGTDYYPWILDPENPGGVATTGVDTINVCERVHIDNADAGQWTIHVTGTLNMGESQTFGIAANATLVPLWLQVSGVVTDSETSETLHAQVSVAGGQPSTLTQDDGSYVLMLPGSAVYTLHAVSSGYAPEDVQVNVTGNVTQNFALEPAENGTVTGTVVSQYGMPLEGAELRFEILSDIFSGFITGENGVYSAGLPGANRYRAVVDYLGAVEYNEVFVPENGTAALDFTINNRRFDPAGPDGYGYYAYEAHDQGLPAVYDWFEISPEAGGPGTQVSDPSGNDWVVSVAPSFPVRFYGQEQNSLRISADGWIGVGPGSNGDQPYANGPIPTTDAPNGIICLFWDDLYPYEPTAGGDVSYYDDAVNNRFIVEYHNVPHYNPLTNRVTAQLVIYSQEARPTLTGDNEFVLQYQYVDYEGPGGEVDADATIGIESYGGDDGIEIVFDGGYHTENFEIGAGTAIRFTTGTIAGFGIVEGTISTIPMLADQSVWEIVFGDYTIHPDASGYYLVSDVIANVYDMTVTLEGYETGSMEEFEVIVDGTTTLDFEQYRLDPPRNMVGEYVSSVPEIRLIWERPEWTLEQPAQGRRGESQLDDFVEYEIWLGLVGIVGRPSLNDTTFVYPVQQSRNYNFWVKAIYDGGISDTTSHFRIDVDLSAETGQSGIPDEYYLNQNYPNPFNPETRITYGLPQAGPVHLELYNVVGQRVAVLYEGLQREGHHAVTFSADKLGTGVYYYRLTAGDFQAIRKMVLIR